MKQCNTCGREFASTDRFCQFCGTGLVALSARPAAVAPMVAPVTTVPATPPVVSVPSIPTPREPRAPRVPRETANPNGYEDYRPWSTAAIIGFVALLLGLVVVAIPFAHGSLYENKGQRVRGKGLAVATLILGYPVLAIWIVVIISTIVTVSNGSR